MRLFVAVEVGEDVRSAVAAAVAPLRESLRLRWVAPERYHLTLVFLGDVAEERVPAVSRALGSACAGVAPFELALSGRLGTFGRRVLWAGLEASPALTSLAAAATEQLRPVVALPDDDRPFSAHLTLARSGRDWVSRDQVAEVAVPALAWPVDRVVLMRSAGGYSVVRAVTLDGGDA